MLTAYPFEYNERSFPVSQRILVHQPLRVNCSSGELLDMKDIVGLKQGSKYTVHSAGSSSMGNAYTSSVRNTGTVPTADQHYFAPLKGDRVSNRPFSRPGSSSLVFPSEKDLKQQQSHVAMLHMAGSPHVDNLNLGDGLLSVMLTVTETKLAYIQYLREQASQARKTGIFFVIVLW